MLERVRIEEFKVEAQVMDYLQCLHYECLAYKSIMEDILTLKRNYEHNKETYKAFMEDYKKSFTKFEMAKSEILAEYCPQYMSDKYSCDFDFVTRTLTILEVQQGGCSSCQC